MAAAPSDSNFGQGVTAVNPRDMVKVLAAGTISMSKFVPPLRRFPSYDHLLKLWSFGGVTDVWRSINLAREKGALCASFTLPGLCADGRGS